MDTPKKTKTKPDKKGVKGRIDLDPVLKESRDQSHIDILVKLGLGDPKDLIGYRKAMMDPVSAIATTQYRSQAAHVLEELLDLIFSDQNLYLKIRQLLESRHGHYVDEGIMDTLGKAAKSVMVGTKGVVADTAKDVAGELLANNLGLLGSAIAKRALKRDGKKKP